jgi:hypothetical protein
MGDNDGAFRLLTVMIYIGAFTTIGGLGYFVYWVGSVFLRGLGWVN